MSTQLEHPVRPQKPDEDPAPTDPLPSDTSDARNDGDRATTLLLLFLVAATVMVGDVVVAAAVAEWWVLVPAFGVLLAMTVLVLAGIARLIAER